MSRSVRLTAQANSIAVRLTAEEDDMNKARALLEEAKNSSPRGTTWLQIGRAYMELEDFSASHQALAQARQDLKNNPALELFSAILCIDENETAAAQKHLDELQRLCPDNQALPTARALCLLRQKKIADALNILRHPHSESEKYDLAVSPLLISRLASAVEMILLPQELPPKELLQAKGGSQHIQIVEDRSAESCEESPSTGDIAQSPADTEIPNANAPAQDPGIADPAAFAQELLPHLPQLPDGMAVGGFRLRGSGTERLQRSWNLPESERSKQFKLAVHELYQAYTASPTAYQSAFNLAEGLLAMAEYGRERSLPYDAYALTLVRFAEQLLREALIRDKDTAFASHYLARTALLQHRYTEAADYWKSALDHFAKLPEAYYGLGQAMIMLKKNRLGRLYIAQAVNSDMHLLRERLADLEYVAKHRTDMELGE
ncbi:MAG: hypothetical protein Q4F00_11575 [bacterium]|nr:hypothetical protein [bacterium]